MEMRALCPIYSPALYGACALISTDDRGLCPYVLTSGRRDEGNAEYGRRGLDAPHRRAPGPRVRWRAARLPIFVDGRKTRLTLTVGQFELWGLASIIVGNRWRGGGGAASLAPSGAGLGASGPRSRPAQG